jgi:CheY-like chemotaxis protein
MKDLSFSQIEKIFELAGIKSPEVLSEDAINKALIEIEKNLSTCACSISDTQSNKNVLIVDDLEFTLHQLTLLLSKSGFNTHVSRNIEEAKQYIQMHNYNFIIVDLFLPQPEDGIGLIKYIKQNEQCKNNTTKIVVISGTDNQSLVAEALNSGANEFIPKSSEWHVNLLKFFKITENNSDQKDDNFTVNLDYSSGKIVHIIIKKFHSQEIMSQILSEVAGYANSGYQNIILDFSNISNINAEQAELIANCYAKTSQSKIGLSLCSISNEIYSTLSYVFLSDIISIYKNIQDAVDKVNSR